MEYTNGFGGLTLEVIEMIPLRKKLEILHEIAMFDLAKTMDYYQEAAGLEQTYKGGYMPGFYGSIWLEKGFKGLVDLPSLNEKGISELLFMIIRDLKTREDFLRDPKNKCANGVEVTVQTVNSSHIIRESFRLV